ncbi:MAG TPA: hypothetical protein VF603_15735 [Allosphingosinicella sp.]|jgi:hypothetical protein
MRPYLLLIACAVVTAAPATASAETGTAPASTAETSREAGQAASERPICRRVVGTGSVMRRRVCRPRNEWDAVDARAQSETRRSGSQEHSGGSAAGNR